MAVILDLNIGVIVLILACVVTAYADRDPCHNYTELVDGTLQATVQHVGWYRFVSTESGQLATSCPDDDVCSSPDGVIWINDTLVTDSVTTVTICLSTNTDCCSQENYIQAKLCDGYFVYQLITIPRQVAYCFNNSDGLPIMTIAPNKGHTTEIAPTLTTEHTPPQANGERITTVARETSHDPKQTTSHQATTEVSRDWSTGSPTTNGISKTSPEILPTMDDSSVNKTVIIVVVVVLVALCAGLAVGCIVINRRKRKSGNITNVDGIRMREPRINKQFLIYS